MLLAALVVVDVLSRASPSPRPDRALTHPGHASTHQLVVGDVVVVEAPEELVVLTKNLRCLVEDLPAVVAGSLQVVQRVRVPVVPALVAGCTRPNPRHPGHTGCR